MCAFSSSFLLFYNIDCNKDTSKENFEFYTCAGYHDTVPKADCISRPRAHIFFKRPTCSGINGTLLSSRKYQYKVGNV